MKHRITETEIIEVLLGTADPELDRRVREALTEDAALAARYEHWRHVIPATKAEGDRARAVGRKVSQQVMEQINRRPELAPVRAARSLRRPGLLGQWRPVLALAGLAVVTLASVSIMKFQARPHAESQSISEKQVAAAGIDTTCYVDFSFNGPEKYGTFNQPYRSLKEAVAGTKGNRVIRIKSGRITTTQEPLFVNKAVRIEALGGRVRIGKI